MSSKGWLSKEDFAKLDDLFSKMGFGGFYDFLECLKEICSKIGAFTVEGGEVDRESLKTIPDVMGCLEGWAEGIFSLRFNNNYQLDKDVLKMLEVKRLRKK
jgi:hypothetical protein